MKGWIELLESGMLEVKIDVM